MTKNIFFILWLLPVLLHGQVDFHTWFEERSLRFDFLLGGNAGEVKVYPAQMKQEPFWGGSKNNLIDPFGYGTYRFRVFDLQSGRLLFSRGFSTLFQEWQTTAEARVTHRAFYQAAFFPFPKKPVRLEIDCRQRNGEFKTIFQQEIDPDDYFIQRETGPDRDIFKILENGNPEKKVDIVILAEGYTRNEFRKFKKDAERVTGYLFEVEPFRSEKNHFNVRAVFTPSVESGTDVPGEDIYRNTFFNSTFYTFDTPRYLTSDDMKTIYDVAAAVPYDQIYLLVNTKRYGGGGFYNFLNVCSADNTLTPPVFVHEFGHGFAGLGDEYFTSDVAYEDYYNLEIEPWEPNLTTLVCFEEKWENMVPDSVPVPTPREPQFTNTVGVYEGGGYMAKGIYSPFIHCRMRSNNAAEFCPVCTEAIRRVIDFYCD